MKRPSRPMNSRQRVLLALNHQAPDRIPIDFWASPAVIEDLERKLSLSYEGFLDRYDVDLRYIEGPRYIGPTLAHGEDIWGVRRSSVKVTRDACAEVYQEVTISPLAGMDSVAEIAAYRHWPSPDWFDYSCIEEQCDRILAGERVVVFMGDRLNRIAQLKPAMYVRGAEDIFMDMAVRPELAACIFGRIKAFYLEYLTRILEAGKGKIDIVLTGDDFGAQHNLLVSPAMWHEHLAPGFREYIERVHAHQARCMHHTCGAVAGLIPDMLACGLDVLQSCQPEAGGMEMSVLKAAHGKHICFQGGISIQKTLPFGTPADIREEVEALADLFRDDGGYIFCTAHNIQADTSVANIVALMEAYHEFGRREAAGA
ncbi:MAG: uroporphyrinogen decarboxylase family protein [Kiritimatiellae bacterium]|nr:uroporphyrinogen decarboxylase family protein [Kiritimatiellia bacterium]